MSSAVPLNLGIARSAGADAAGGGKRVLLAEPRGYCAGVDRAVETVEKALEKHGAPIYVRKEIVHTGTSWTRSPNAASSSSTRPTRYPRNSVLVFSAHGVSPAVHTAAAERSLHTIDATCPLVTKVHQEAKRFARDDYDILLIGHEGHEEVEGTAGEAPEHVQIVDGPDSVDAITVRDEDKVIWLSQTTLSVDETMETVERLREKFPKLQDPPSDDICYATQNRQVAVKAMAPECDLVIVVGSRNSSNSVRLVEVALGAGARAAHLVDFAREVDLAWLEGVRTVGITSGASVPRSWSAGSSTCWPNTVSRTCSRSPPPTRPWSSRFPANCARRAARTPPDQPRTGADPSGRGSEPPGSDAPVPRRFAADGPRPDHAGRVPVGGFAARTARNRITPGALAGSALHCGAVRAGRSRGEGASPRGRDPPAPGRGCRASRPECVRWRVPPRAGTDAPHEWVRDGRR
ncbi:4-hydroxy-3-methylbut-2-enyl diphosphate reductase [Rhodococcus hoagii]|nr:4-hydroxy-3-methylbut-2-enyl diphosphate reductase [Prescottella equi]